MKKRILTTVLAGAALAISLPAQADPQLFDWGYNDDGTTYCAFDPFCDFNDGSVPASVDDSGFDYDSGLGSVEVTITGEGAHFFDFFLDHEIEEEETTFFNEYGEATGTPDAIADGDDGDQSWGLDDPFNGFIFDDFLNSFLFNVNDVPQGGCTTGDDDDIFDGECWDVSMALGWDFTLSATETAIINFLVGTTAPGTDFYLSHTDPLLPETIFFSSTLRISGDEPPPPPPTEVPEPGTLFLLGAGLLGIGAARRRRLINNR